MLCFSWMRFWIVAGFSTRGTSYCWAIGIGGLVVLDIRRWAGEPRTPSRAMFLRFKRSRYTSDLARWARSISCFVLLTAHSASPLLCGYSGLLMTWWKFHWLAKCLNAWLVNCLPLSVCKRTTWPGSSGLSGLLDLSSSGICQNELFASRTENTVARPICAQFTEVRYELSQIVHHTQESL